MWASSFTSKCSVAVAAILVVTGCTSSSSSSGGGCSSAAGFEGGGKSELGEGTFEYDDDVAKPSTFTLFATNETPPIAKGGRFTLTFERNASEKKQDEDFTLRSSSSEKLFDLGATSAGGSRFDAKANGIVAVFAMSTKNKDQVVDLVHVRIVEPKEIRVDGTFLSADYAEKALEKGKVSVPKGRRQTLKAYVYGDVDEQLVALGGLAPKWETSDKEVVAFEKNDDGTVDAESKKIGSADVTVSAGDVKKVIHVTVTEDDGYAR